MESTLQLKQSLISTIGSINDPGIIASIMDFVKRTLGKSSAKAKTKKQEIEVAPEVWNIIKRIHPVDVEDEKKEYYEHLDKKHA